MAKGHLTDDEILARVLSKSQDAVGWAQQKLSIERERVAKYLNGEWPKRNSEGSSSYFARLLRQCSYAAGAAAGCSQPATISPSLTLTIR
jgi:hypothetical protein